MEIIGAFYERGRCRGSARNPTQETTVESHPSKNEGWGTRLRSISGPGSQYDWTTRVVRLAQQVRFAMLFRCTFEVKGLANRLAEAEGLEFRFENPRSIVIRLSKNYPDDSKPSDPSDMVGISTTSAEVTDTKIASELVAGLSTSLDGRWANLKGADPSTGAFLHSMVDELQAVMSSTIALLRWRDGLAEGPPEAYHNSRGYYSADAENWCEVSMVRGLEIRMGIPYGPMTPAIELSKEVVELRNAGTEEPIGHQLLGKLGTTESYGLEVHWQSELPRLKLGSSS